MLDISLLTKYVPRQVEACQIDNLRHRAWNLNGIHRVKIGKLNRHHSQTNHLKGLPPRMEADFLGTGSTRLLELFGQRMIKLSKQSTSIIIDAHRKKKCIEIYLLLTLE